MQDTHHGSTVQGIHVVSAAASAVGTTANASGHEVSRPTTHRSSSRVGRPGSPVRSFRGAMIMDNRTRNRRHCLQQHSPEKGECKRFFFASRPAQSGWSLHTRRLARERDFRTSKADASRESAIGTLGGVWPP
ncbi:hypothetical protein MRX96_028760 [Rhipicephalus microplus]